jgi:hypothetical protein
MNARRLTTATLGVLCSMLGALALCGASAQAETVTHPYLFQLTGTPSGAFSEKMCGVATDPASGDIYIADPGSNAIDIFSSTGVYQSQISGMSVPTGSFTEGACSVAVSDKTGDVYVADSGAEAVYVFDALGGWISTITGLDTPADRSFENNLLVAVDQTNGEIDIAEGGHEPVIYRFNSEEKFRSKIEPETEELPISGLAADSNGDVYMLEQESVFWYNSAGNQIGRFYPGGGGLPDGLAVDSAGHIYVGSPSEDFVMELNSSGSSLNTTTTIATIPSSERHPTLNGFAVAGNGDLDIAESVREDQLGPRIVQVFGSEAEVVLPNVETNGSSNVGGTSATISGTVNPEGTATTYQFEYGTSEACGCGSVLPASPASVGSDSSNHALSAELTGLVPGTEYYYRVVATNANGTNFGRVEPFETPLVPQVATGSVSGLAETTAALEGTVNPEGKATTYQFEYETQLEYEQIEKYEVEHRTVGDNYVQEKPYGSLAPAVPGSVGSDTSAHTVSAGLSGLTPGGLYHYRVTATNSAGTARGEDATFAPDGPPGVDGESVAGVTRTGATIEAEVRPDGYDTHVYVEYGTSTGYGSSSPPVDIGSGSGDQSVSISLSGLRVGTLYHFRVVASNGHGAPVAGADVSFTTVPAALIKESSFADAGSASVAVSAKVDDLGTDSSYYYEYGTGESYGSATSVADVGAVDGYVGAPAVLNGLQPDTVYHFRLVVMNETGTSDGEDVAFSTLPLGIQGLPDGRVYEMVTPSENYNADIYTPHGQGDSEDSGVRGKMSLSPFQAAAGGSAVVYAGQPTSGGNGTLGEVGNEYLATRSPQGGWTQVNLQPAGYSETEYQAFSSELSVGVLQSSYSCEGLAPLAAGAPGDCYRVLYASSGDGGFQSLFTGTPPNRDSDEFKTAGTGRSLLGLVGASADFGHLLFAANDALTPAAEVSPPSAGENDLYDSVGGRLYLVNVLPDGLVAPGATFGGSGGMSGRVISADGSRVFWSDPGTGGLYVRENDDSEREDCAVAGDACTVQVDASQNPGVASGGGELWTSSSDGSKVFFTDCRRLTSNSTAVSSGGCGGDLYEYDLESGVLSDLTVDQNASDQLGANVLGVVGASENGEYVYFVATGNLASGASSAGQPNFYVWHNGTTTFITTMSLQDNEEDQRSASAPPIGPWQRRIADRTAEVTPDGRSLVFSTPETAAGKSRGEVYRYGVEDGRLVCVSCSPSVAVANVSEQPVVGVKGGFLPVREDGEDGITYPANEAYQPRWVSEDGSRVFFDSFAGLVPRDVNGLQDVYEWERDGSGSCRESPGCVYLISSGTSSSWSSLLDTGASGNDAFIITRSRLVPEDEDENFNVFDARVGGMQPLAPSACSGTGCQGVPSAPPVFATPSSVTYDGVGNFPPSTTKPAAKTKRKAKAKTKRKARTKKKGRKATAKARTKAKRGKGKRGAQRSRGVRRSGESGSREAAHGDMAGERIGGGGR